MLEVDIDASVWLLQIFIVFNFPTSSCRPNAILTSQFQRWATGESGNREAGGYRSPGMLYEKQSRK
jgi:hypothetical protein